MNDRSNASLRNIRVLLLATPGHFQLPIIQGIKDGGGELVGVVEPCNKPISRLRAWRRRWQKMVKQRWPYDIVKRLTFTHDVNDAEFQGLLRRRKVDLIVVSRWGLLSPEFTKRVPLGVINTHISMLPELRGKHPIAGALLANLESTGVTVHYIDSGIDTGNIISQQLIPIAEQDTTRTITVKAAASLRPMYRNILLAFRSESVHPISQNSPYACYFSWKTVFGSNPPQPLLIDWEAPAWLITRVVRLRCCSIKTRDGVLHPICQIRPVRPSFRTSMPPGVVISKDKATLTVTANEGHLDIVLGNARGNGDYDANRHILPQLGEALESATWPRWKSFTTWVARRSRHTDNPEVNMGPRLES